MRFPTMQSSGRRILNMPDLSGGLNTRDSLNGINDNQLTDTVNMWYRGGMLKTRPGLTQTADEVIPVSSRHIGESLNVRAFPIRRVEDGVPQQLICWYTVEDVPATTVTDMYFAWSYKGGHKDLPHIGVNTSTPHFFAVQFQSDIYLFVSGDLIASTVYCLKKDAKEWTEVSDDEIYAPLIAINVNPNPKYQKEILAHGTMVEGYNLIGSYYRIWYNKADETIDVSKDPFYMYYFGLYKAKTLEEINYYAGKKVIAKVTDSKGVEYTHTLIIWNGEGFETEEPGDGLYMKCDMFSGVVSFYTSPNGEIAQITEIDGSNRNGIELTLPCPNPAKNLDKVFGMTRAEWFGGASAGLNGGTRLFLCGNEYEKERNLVIWSDLNKPLYFPENCYAYVGDSSQSVTAFGKQSDMLIVFKERETWYMKYAQNTGITASDLIYQNVVDYTANAVYFPLVLINATVGCDCPDTVQLCRNRLVWANSDGNIYTLVSESQYNERSIFAVSDMITRRLKQEDLTGACACDWNGYYLLLVGAHLYVMDYNSYGYQYISSYSKVEDANIRIPWFYWEIPVATDNVIFANDDALSILYITEMIGEIAAGVARLDEAALVDTVHEYMGALFGLALVDHPIQCTFTTKLFDFGAPNRRKQIETVGLSFGNNEGEPISVTFVTDAGTEETTVHFDGSDTDERAAGYIASKILMPSIRASVRFGVQCRCNGTMTADGLTITYKLLGGAR